MIKYIGLLSVLMFFSCNGSYPIDKHTWNYFKMVNCLKTVVIPQEDKKHLHHIFQLYMPCKLLGRDGRTMSILCDDSFEKLNVPKEYNTPYHPFISISSCGLDYLKIVNPLIINKILFENNN